MYFIVILCDTQKVVHDRKVDVKIKWCMVKIILQTQI